MSVTAMFQQLSEESLTNAPELWHEELLEASP